MGTHTTFAFLMGSDARIPATDMMGTGKQPTIPTLFTQALAQVPITLPGSE